MSRYIAICIAVNQFPGPAMPGLTAPQTNRGPMKNLKEICKALGWELRKGGYGYVVFNQHHLRIYNEYNLEDVTRYICKKIMYLQANTQPCVKV
jgi:hypothetical protein